MNRKVVVVIVIVAIVSGALWTIAGMQYTRNAETNGIAPENYQALQDTGYID